MTRTQTIDIIFAAREIANTVSGLRELIPTDSRKSFYGKAKTYRDECGNETLLSYDTPVVMRTADGELIRLWDGWSATTGRHIASFCGLNKAGFDKLPRLSELSA